MTETEFTALVQGLRTEASHWFNNAALLELEKLIVWAERGFVSAQGPTVSTKLPQLTEYELQILFEVGGREPASQWGAAVGVALEYLYESGYITHVFGGKLTAKGQAAAKTALDNPPSGV